MDVCIELKTIHCKGKVKKKGTNAVLWKVLVYPKYVGGEKKERGNISQFLAYAYTHKGTFVPLFSFSF